MTSSLVARRPVAQAYEAGRVIEALRGPVALPPMMAATVRRQDLSDAERVIAGEREAERVIARHRAEYAEPDALLDSLREVLAADGLSLPSTLRLRGWARRIGKAIAQS